MTTTLNFTAGRLAAAAATAGLVLLVVLHALRPDLNPAWHVLSEYGVGKDAWVMTLYFLCVAISCISLFVALFSKTRNLAVRTGLAFLALAGLGLAMAALFPMDPITTSPDKATFSGMMHELAGTIGVPSQLLAAIILSCALARETLWRRLRVSMLVTASLSWLGVMLLMISIGVLMQHHTFGGPWMVGWANRLFMVAFAGWVIVASRPFAANNMALRGA